MSGLAKLQRRSQELALLSLETCDAQMRNMLMMLSREFKREADRMTAMDGRDDDLSHLVPRNYQT
jgi:hypothetical protein